MSANKLFFIVKCFQSADMFPRDSPDNPWRMLYHEILSTLSNGNVSNYFHRLIVDWIFFINDLIKIYSFLCEAVCEARPDILNVSRTFTHIRVGLVCIVLVNCLIIKWVKGLANFIKIHKQGERTCFASLY